MNVMINKYIMLYLKNKLSFVVLISVIVLSNTSRAETSSLAIGKATLIIGKAFVTRSGHKTVLKRGNDIYIGDKVSTLSNGHVHIKFKDKGIVSVRPNSKLDIQNYQYDAQRPKSSEVKFELMRGVVRSVSGKAAKSARDKFRMNTPIAAIGVRGTDFIVSANHNKIQAFVNEGAIVVSPFSDLCTAAALGPCSNNAVELLGSTGQLLELNNQQTLATIRSTNGEILPALLYQSENKVIRKKKKKNNTFQIAKNENSEDKKQGFVTTVNTETINPAEINIATSESTTQLDPTSKEGIQEEVDTNEIVVIDTGEILASVSASTTDNFTFDIDAVELVAAVGVDPTSPIGVIVDSNLTTDFTDPTPFQLATPIDSISTDLLDKRQLVWGRWNDNLGEVNEKLSVSYSIATANRDVTIANSALGLFRQNYGTLQLADNLGNINFDLELADIDFVNADSIQQMGINAAALNINFNTNNFTTSLSLQNDTTGILGFSAQGNISDSGIFSSISTDQKLAGAVSLDGAEAGYFFEKELDNGTLQGNTLWGRAP
jgi:hypothetical protein